jgi:hypothetical protein
MDKGCSAEWGMLRLGTMVQKWCMRTICIKGAYVLVLHLVISKKHVHCYCDH